MQSQTVQHTNVLGKRAVFIFGAAVKKNSDVDELHSVRLVRVRAISAIHSLLSHPSQNQLCNIYSYPPPHAHAIVDRITLVWIKQQRNTFILTSYCLKARQERVVTFQKLLALNYTMILQPTSSIVCVLKWCIRMCIWSKYLTFVWRDMYNRAH